MGTKPVTAGLGLPAPPLRCQKGAGGWIGHQWPRINHARVLKPPEEVEDGVESFRAGDHVEVLGTWKPHACPPALPRASAPSGCPDRFPAFRLGRGCGTL